MASGGDEAIGAAAAEAASDEDEKRSTHTSDDEDEDDLGLADALDEETLEKLVDLKLTAGKEPSPPPKKQGALSRFLSTLGILKPKKETTVLSSLDLDGIVDYIQSGKAKRIITMAGAGISTSAGIPDFRSPGTGLYDNLQKYDLPDPMAIFAIEYFRRNPQPFFDLAKALYPGKFEPTPCHYFVRLLHEKGLLLRHYTQNIDTLERVAGIPEEKLVEAHGTFHTAHCIDCRKAYTQEFVKEKVFADSVPTCTDCNGVVKPDIVFFGENLPHRFYNLVTTDFGEADLLIVMGTSLTVQPFASLVNRVSDTCPRLLINKEKTGNSGTDFILRLFGHGGMDFDSKQAYRDVACLGTCDDGCKALADKLGWKNDLEELIASGKSQES